MTLAVRDRPLTGRFGPFDDRPGARMPQGMRKWVESKGPGPWIANAPCGRLPVQDVDALFFGPDPGLAASFCEVCPVKAQCADMAAGNPALVGVFAGRPAPYSKETDQ